MFHYNTPRAASIYKVFTFARKCVMVASWTPAVGFLKPYNVADNEMLSKAAILAPWKNVLIPIFIWISNN